jgi:hemerythrin
MTVDFTDDMKIGIERIDKQHEELTLFLNQSYELIRTIPCKDVINAKLEFLASYAVFHFQDEERLQVESNYPDYEKHRAEHETFKKEFQLIRVLCTQGNMTGDELASLLTQKVLDWVYTHIKGEDIEFGRYYHRAKNSICLMKLKNKT